MPLRKDKGSWVDQEFISDEESLARLADRVWRFCGSGKEQVQKTLTYAFATGNLIRSEREGNTRWSWRDYLEKGNGL